ncbi:phage tail assembly protein [Salmonella enterica]|nr:phage tail assembly protein [Salmonella enterica]
MYDSETDDYLTVTLKKPLEREGVRYEEITLSEPALIQVEQFYDMQKKTNALTAMRLLISLVSQVPESALRQMRYTDFLQCEAYMTRFLTWTPSGSGGS